MSDIFTIKSDCIDDIIKKVNKHRLNSFCNWYYIRIEYKTKVFLIKAHNTWMQIFRDEENERNHPSPMDIKVSEFKNHIKYVLLNN